MCLSAITQLLLLCLLGFFTNWSIHISVLELEWYGSVKLLLLSLLGCFTNWSLHISVLESEW